MRNLIQRFDAWICRIEKVYVFCNDAECILRLQVRGAPHLLHFATQDIQKGQPVLMLHLWNERIPLMLPAGPDMSWAVETYRKFSRSLCKVGRYIQSEPGGMSVQAVGGVSALFSLANPSSGVRMLHRLGFEVIPYQNPWGGLGEFWENFYSWWLIWAYNPASLRYRRFFRQQRTEIWMPIAEFLRRYG